jgi:hypothetical protein
MNRKLKYLASALVVVAAAGFAVGQLGGQGGSPFCSNPNVAIPEPAGGGSVTDSQVIANSFSITDLNVSVQIPHSWVGDLTITLAKTAGPGSPIGPITIMARPGVPASTFGCSINDINATLDDQAATEVEVVCNPAPPAIGPGPYNPDPGGLNASFAGVDINGTWALNVADAFNGDTGTLVQWCLITTPVPVELMEFAIE